MSTFAIYIIAAWLALTGPVAPAAEQGGILDFGPVSERSGWLLAGRQLYWTDTAGTTWRDITPDGIEEAQAAAAAFTQDGRGWLVSAAADATGVARYTLARTEDRGQTWQQAALALFADSEAGNYPAALYLERLDAVTGWLVVKHVTSSNFSAGDLFRTTDGGQTWERLSLPLGEPVQFASANVGYVKGGPTGTAAYRTTDGGQTWQQVLATEDTEKTEGSDVVRMKRARDGAAWAAYARGACDRAAGRCTQTAGLRFTTNGGQAWSELPLPAGVPAGRTYTLTPTATPSGLPAARTQAMTGYGFDKCELARPEELQDWIVDSPYTAVNLYVGGSARACSNRALSAPLLRQIATQGWSFIPTWVGPQAPCYAHEKVRMNPDPAAAYWQGQAEASAAADVLAGLGLTEANGHGSIVYYDMEYYDTTDTLCHEAVKSFIAGWTEQLHRRGQLSGVYGTGPTISGFANQPEPPDAIWAAHWIRDYFDPSVTVWDVFRLSNDLWVNNQRLRQYTGGHNETWGTTTLNVDADVLAGIVAVVPPRSLPPRVWLPNVIR